MTAVSRRDLSSETQSRRKPFPKKKRSHRPESVENPLFFIGFLYGGNPAATRRQPGGNPPATRPGKTTWPRRKTYTTRTLRSRSREIQEQIDIYWKIFQQWLPGLKNLPKSFFPRARAKGSCCLRLPLGVWIEMQTMPCNRKKQRTPLFFST